VGTSDSVNGRKHGTISCYNRGCHCDTCRAAATEYKRAWKLRQGHKPQPPRGPSVIVDVGAIKRAAAASEWSLNDLSREAGLTDSAVHKITERGRCGLYTLDVIACRLGRHMSEFMQEAVT
jgi:hypothetical protein